MCPDKIDSTPTGDHHVMPPVPEAAPVPPPAPETALPPVDPNKTMPEPVSPPVTVPVAQPAPPTTPPVPQHTPTATGSIPPPVPQYVPSAQGPAPAPVPQYAPAPQYGAVNAVTSEDPLGEAKGTSTAAMVVGVIGLVCSVLFCCLPFVSILGIILGIIGLILSLSARKKTPEGVPNNLATAGLICSIVALVVGLLVVVVWAIILATSNSPSYLNSLQNMGNSTY